MERAKANQIDWAAAGASATNTQPQWNATDQALEFGPPGAGGSLDSLSDVDTSTTAPTDGQTLVFHAATGLWVPGTISGGGSGGSAGRVLLQKTTLAADGPSFSFPSTVIPTSGYANLELAMRCRSAGSSGSVNQDYVKILFNGDSTLTNYYSKLMQTAGSLNNIEGPNLSRVAFIPGVSAPAEMGQVTTRLSGFLLSSMEKIMESNFFFRYSTSTSMIGHGATRWNNTAPVTSMTVTTDSGANFVAGSTAWLYALV